MAWLRRAKTTYERFERARALIESSTLDNGEQIIMLASARAAEDGLAAIVRRRTFLATPAGPSLHKALRSDAGRDNAHRMMTWLLIWQNYCRFAEEWQPAISAARGVLPMSDAEYARLVDVFKTLQVDTDSDEARADAVEQFKRASFDIFVETVTGRTWPPDPTRARAESELANERAAVAGWGRILVDSCEWRFSLINVEPAEHSGD